MRRAAKVRTLDSLIIGERVFFERHIEASDVDAFAHVSGDHNPLHTDEAYAKTTRFGKRVVHGMFLGALVSQIVGMEMPGQSALLFKESLEFKKPVYIGDTVTVSATLQSKSASTGLIELAIEILRGTEVVVIGSVNVRML